MKTQHAMEMWTGYERGCKRVHSRRPALYNIPEQLHNSDETHGVISPGEAQVT